MELTQKVIEQLATVFIGVEAVVDVRLQPRVYVTVIKFSVKNKKNLIC